MERPAKSIMHFFTMFIIASLTACTQINPEPVPTPTATAFYSLARGGTCVTLGQHPQPPYANIQVSHDVYKAHSEPMLVEDPENPLHLVGGSKFFTDTAHYKFQIGFYSSFDGGCTWRDGGLLPGFSATGLTSDPSFAFGPHNTVYASVLETGQAKNPADSGIAVSISHDGGRSFGPPSSVFDDGTGRTFSDKPWLAVDQTGGAHSGTIYVVWSYDHGSSCGGAGFCQQDLGFARSTDGGKTFSPLHTIEGHAPFCTDDVPGRTKGSITCDEALGATPVVEPDGTLVVAFGYVDQLSRAPTRLLVVSSPDGGTSWTSPVQVAKIHDIQGTFPPEKYRNESLPAFACDPRSGQLYLAWADKGTRDADILLTTSNDHGQTWSKPVRVNDDPLRNGANQFQPQLAVAPDGVVSVSFFDTRLDPKQRLIDVYLAQSIDFGATFRKNMRITTQSLNPALGAPIDGNGLQFIGDYQGLAADNSFVHPFWNDMRTGKQEVFTAAIASVRK